MNCYELFRIAQFSHVFTDVLHSMCNVLLRRVKPQCPEPAAKVAMGNVSCHPREKPSDDAELVVQNVQNDNPMHFRRLQRSHFSWNHLEHVSCRPFLEFRQLEVLVVHLYLQHMLIHWSFNGPIVIHTASHSTISHLLAAFCRNIPVPVEILPPLPELHDFKGDASRGVAMARMARALYEDPDFPATDGSIGGVTGDHANPNAAKYLQEMMKLIVPGWVRPAEMIGKKAGKYELWGTEGEPCLFNRVSPYDIKQGYLGDCWLVSAMSTLAEYPDHVRRLFKQKTLSEDGRYDVRLYDPTSEEWKLVTIDDRLPYWQRPGKHGNLCFAAQTPQNEFWPCLLEKAVAKFVMGFYRLDRGWESVAQEMLTGKPSVCMVLDPMPNGYHSPFHIITGKTPWTARHATVYMRKETFDLQYRYYGADASSLVGGKTRFTDEEMWSVVKEWDDKGYCQSCGSRTNYKGILAGLQWVVQKTIENRKNLINLRCSV